MGYDLCAKNKKLKGFHFGAFSFPVLLEACGYFFECIQNGPKWLCSFKKDKRMGKEYPAILCNDGFKITAEEAKVMARIARNFVTIQRGLSDSHRNLNNENKWPMKIRDDFTDKFEKFAKWADKSNGFAIY